MSDSFLERIDERTRSALASGDLLPIHTEESELVDAGLRFLARKVSTLAGKPAAVPGGPRNPDFNPFLNPDPALVLGPIGARHTAILNKFPVSQRHVVIITTGFREQLEPLDRDDCAALAAALSECGGLGFYNGGTLGGASQRHKHVQWLPTAPGNASLQPWRAGLPGDAPTGTIATHPALALPHCFVRVDCARGMPVEQIAGSLHDGYRQALDHLVLRVDEAGLLPPLNLLVEDGWLLLVPRGREHFETISINALAFGGTFFVRDDEELAGLRQAGPLRALATVGIRR